jgi:hypothetical protein
MSKFNLTRDINGYNGFGLKFCEDNQSAILAANVEQHFTVPGNYANWIAIFSYEPGASVWVADNFTAVVPSGSLAATFSELNPTAREVKAGDVISLITSDDNVQVGICLYAL